MKARLAAALIALAGLTSSCSMFHPAKDCEKPQAYESSQSIARLKIPPGLDAPDTKEALAIPEVSAPEAPRTATGGCLDEPPQYRTETPASPASPDKPKQD
ncbi:MAG: hypothetical protein ACRETU_01480 [Steroidobacterales bacterium]